MQSLHIRSSWLYLLQLNSTVLQTTSHLHSCTEHPVIHVLSHRIMQTAKVFSNDIVFRWCVSASELTNAKFHLARCCCRDTHLTVVNIRVSHGPRRW